MQQRVELFDYSVEKIKLFPKWFCLEMDTPQWNQNILQWYQTIKQ